MLLLSIFLLITFDTYPSIVLHPSSSTSQENLLGSINPRTTHSTATTTPQYWCTVLKAPNGIYDTSGYL